MANQAFKYFTIQAGGVPQPLVGSYLTAPIVLSQTQAANRREHQNPISLAVADSSMFIGQGWLNVVDPGTYFTERAQIFSVPDATHVMVQGLASAHPGGAYGTGSWVALGALVQNVFVQGLDGDTGALYIGTTPLMVKATGFGVMFKLVATAAGVNPYYFSTSRQVGANTETLSQYWIDGTTGDSYLPSVGVI